MANWWEVDSVSNGGVPPTARGIAYYRHSAQDRQENSIPIQQDQVREWAREHGVEIIQEFADHGRSGLTAEGRPAFTDMMENWVKVRHDFQYILCLDVSRWGRFQDIDLSAQFSAECKRANKPVIYTTIGKPREDDPLYPEYVQFERFRAAHYSKELSDKVWRGCAKSCGIATAVASRKKAATPVWPGAWARAKQAGKTLQRDLEAASIPYVDEQGRYADVHVLRHTFITNMMKSGINPKTAQSLARHSTIDLTMNVYTKLTIADQATAIASLPGMCRTEGL